MVCHYAIKYYRRFLGKNLRIAKNNTKNAKSTTKQYEQTMKSFDSLCRKSLQDNIIEKNEYKSLCDTFIKYVEENDFFRSTTVSIIFFQ